MAVCEMCEREYEILNDIDGQEICDDCRDRDYFLCNDCNEWQPKAEQLTLQDGNEICQACFDNGDYCRCHRCEGIIYNDDAHAVDNGEFYVCDDCSGRYSTCDDCGELCTDYYYVEGDIICRECMESDRYATCDGCGEWYYTDNLNYHRGDYYCDNCSHYDIIQDYHDHEEELEFFGDTNNNSVPYLGIELEIDGGRNADVCAGGIRDLFPDNFIYFETDGSLDSGFENITQPATLEYHYGLIGEYKNMMRIAKEHGYKSHNTSTCGIHVHFNRDFFRDDEELYTTRLLYIVEKFWDELVKFSRRNLSNLNRWSKKYNSTPEEVVNIWKNNQYNLDRYQAVNLTCDETIEFRMFRGTLKLNTFIATLQLCHTMIMTARNIESTEAIQSLKWEDLLQFDEVKAYWEEAKDRTVRN